MAVAANLAANLTGIRDRMDRAALRSGREPSCVRLIAVTKTFPVSACAEALEAGIEDLGENYPKELRDKAPAYPQATWHFLGPLQTGTVRYVADRADWVHTLAPGASMGGLGARASRSGR
ncbi:MAG: YggS family pyridoxal phosphate enzyme, partial [Actinobacteria bacterium]|nr:YggS family pyridoxal phosphate enzyme [Actinomycetota bacterium]